MAWYNFTTFASRTITGVPNILNTYDVLTPTPLASSGEAQIRAFDMVSFWLNNIAPVLSTQTFLRRVYAISPLNPDVFGNVVLGTAVQGQRAGDANPDFVTWTFSCVRQRRDIRSGRKAFGLVSESNVLGGVPDAETLARLNTLATAMNAGLTADVDGEPVNYPFIVVKRVPVVEDGKVVSYRLPQTEAEFQYYLANQWSFVEVSTQNTRKRGRGI